MKRVPALLLITALLGACAADDSPSADSYEWQADAAETRAVGAARQMDEQATGVWAEYSDGLLLHFIYDFCVGLDAASDVEEFLDQRVQEQGEALLLPVVIGSPYLCPARSDAVGAWIARHAADQ